jgi:hypothetical protein
MVESCLVLDINDLSARGCLHPGLSGVCRWLDGNGGFFSVKLRYSGAAAAGGQNLLHLSWRDHAGITSIADDDEGKDAREEQEEMSAGCDHGEGGEVTEIIQIVHVPYPFGGSKPFFLCPGKGGGASKDASASEAGANEAGVASEAGANEAGVASEAGASKDGASKDGASKDGEDANAGCGRRAGKLYLVPQPQQLVHGRRPVHKHIHGQQPQQPPPPQQQQSYFLCRSCSGISYTSQHEQPWQRASRRASKLRQRLGITGLGVADKPAGMLVADYERLLEAALQAEIKEFEAGTTHILELAATIKRRRKIQFTL